MSEKLVISGLGVLAPNAIGSEAFCEALRSGQSGIRRLEELGAVGYHTQIGGMIDRAVLSPLLERDEEAAQLDLTAGLCLLAAQMACEEAQIDQPEGRAGLRLAVLIGSACGPVQALEEIYRDLARSETPVVRPSRVQRAFPYSPASAVARRFQAQGACQMVNAGGASSLAALVSAAGLVGSGAVDVALVGGVDCPLAPDYFRLWDAVRLLTRDHNRQPETASRPFDYARSGIVLAEGCGFIVLEREETARARAVPLYAEISGFGQSFCGPSDGRARIEAQTASMVQAIEQSGVQVEHVQASAMSSPSGDAQEAEAIVQALGNLAGRALVSSIKSMIGQSPGAAGMLSLIATVLGMREGFIPPTLNLQEPDAEFSALRFVPDEAQPFVYSNALINAFDPAGQNASVVVREC
ncbi:MAG TPA: beta-ketoacyl-[acyl-carrier-protein] synthase family protein [Candidatus Sumerlaeota bacterium]|nr:beta-ketoacyl-[acyl-carrier-protein] synthase family protein [Candidatus Sumerlaeota bacterium]HPS00354.1 beta-ketoacyl-[acyl-carrier-protein] synthase family protein [Candidatus Sumerlaeota bacterium]